MGNEGSTLKAHASLVSGDGESLKASLAGAAPGLPPGWQVLPKEALARVRQGLGQGDKVSLQAYQSLAGDTVRGCLSSQLSFLLRLSGSPSPLSSTSLHSVLCLLLSSFCRMQGQEEDPSTLATSLLHDTLFSGQKRKATFGKETPVVENLDLGDLENLFLSQPLLEAILQSVLLHLFSLAPRAPLPRLLPSLPPSLSSLSTFQRLFLASNLPHDLRTTWRPVFTTDTHGESFSKFTGCIVNQGPTLTIVWDETGKVFGCFATDSWRLGPKFYGKPESFLFQLAPTMGVYETTPYNSNYQYFNLKQKTMPNGLGMGGQLDYFGLWIDSEFGLVRTSPTCSTYHSPPLADQEGKIKKLEVVALGELSKEDQEAQAGPSVLDMDPEAQAVMEMMGKTFHSKVIREVDQEAERREKQGQE